MGDFGDLIGILIGYSWDIHIHCSYSWENESFSSFIDNFYLFKLQDGAPQL